MDDDIYQQLLDSFNGSEGKAKAKTLLPELLLQNMADADPKLKAIATYLVKQQTETDYEEADDEEEPFEDASDLSPAEPALSRQDAPVNRLQQVATTMYAELEDLRERNDALAAALGACYLCWGEDFDCEECQGQGQPGAFKPDKGLFRQYVAPAIQTLKAAQHLKANRKGAE